MKLKGQLAIVTGGATGIGYALAERLLRLGAAVELWGRTEATLALARSRLSSLGSVTVRRIDVVQREQVLGGAAAAEADHGRIDILVNNAGGVLTPVGRSKASESPEEDTRFLFDVNYLGAVHCCQAVVPVMKRQVSGVIINLSSLAGISTYDGGGALAMYAAAKAALTHYTRYLAAELGPFGIRANCIAPGVILTERVMEAAAKRGIGTDDQAARIPLRRFGRPADCAGVLEFLATDLSQYVTGQVISVCGGSVLTPN